MHVEIDIGFEQLVNLAKKLTSTEWNKLKQEVEKDIKQDARTFDKETFLLSAQSFTKKQLNAIAKTRNAIKQWRMK